MHVKLIFLFLFCQVTELAAAKQDSLGTNSFWIGYKVGSAYSNVSAYQRWTVREGLNNISANTRNTLIGFDMLYNHKRMVYGLNADFELRTFGGAEPYYFNFAFRSGYTVVDQNRFQVKTLGGIGLAYAFVRFENSIPASLQDIDAKYSDPFARVSAMIGRIEALTSFKLQKKTVNHNRSLFQLIVFFNAGVQPVLAHGNWNYGEMVMDTIDGSSFVGERIDMPKFYKANWFACGGIAMSMGNRH